MSKVELNEEKLMELTGKVFENVLNFFIVELFDWLIDYKKG